jgi:uncharacterized membrane protein YhaH (DUF805 family)
MDFNEIKEWYVKPFEKFIEFSGRSRRKEFWTFVLVNLGITILLNVLEGIIGLFGIIATLFSLAILIPSIAVGVRRLHDTGRTGWWLLLSFIPLIGLIVLIYFYVQDSEPGSNQYGPNPKAI